MILYNRDFSARASSSASAQPDVRRRAAGGNRKRARAGQGNQAVRLPFPGDFAFRVLARVGIGERFLPASRRTRCPVALVTRQVIHPLRGIRESGEVVDFPLYETAHLECISSVFPKVFIVDYQCAVNWCLQDNPFRSCES